VGEEEADIFGKEKRWASAIVDGDGLIVCHDQGECRQIAGIEGVQAIITTGIRSYDADCG